MEETDYFEQCFRAGEMTAVDRANLKEIIQSSSFKRAMGACLEGVTGKQQQLVGADLTTTEGVSEALKMQGQVQGMQFIVSELFQLATEEPEEEKEKEDGGED